MIAYRVTADRQLGSYDAALANQIAATKQISNPLDRLERLSQTNIPNVYSLFVLSWTTSSRRPRRGSRRWPRTIEPRRRRCVARCVQAGVRCEPRGLLRQLRRLPSRTVGPLRRRKVWVWALAAVVASAFVGTVAGCGRSGSSASTRANGRLAWKSFARVESNWSIYAANPDGSNRSRLTHPGAGVHDDYPDWSPDGSHILFDRIFQPSSELPTVADEVMRVNADGSGLRQIGHCGGNCVVNDDPQYSPHGRRIVYTRLMRVQPKGSLVLGVWVMDSSGRNSHKLTQLSSPASSEDHEPAWSPDGKNIVFTRLNDTTAPRNQQTLFIVASSGGKARRITPWKLNAGGANWSPNGTTILFQSYRDCSCTVPSQVYTVAADGSDLTQLVGVGTNIEPNWSPDGKKIIYGHEPGTGPAHLSDLWLMDANGKNNKPVVQTTLWESEPDWGIAPPGH
jgi:Tol biopolymer transport system component